MQSLKELYKIGYGPSSSHTIGPAKIAEYVKSEFSDSDYSFKVVLYGSLAFTGKGHGTDRVLKQVLGDNTTIVFDKNTKDLPHPNTLDVIVYKNDEEIKNIRALSIGGGSVKIEGVNYVEPVNIYPHTTFDRIKEYISKRELTLSEYVYEIEPNIKDYLKEVWEVMKASVERGLDAEGVLPGGLNVERKAKTMFDSDSLMGGLDLQCSKCVSSYAFAVAEENADNHKIVTAPTCGASGVLPSVLYYLYRDKRVSEKRIIDGLAVAGIIGNVVKTNASISGAECGCQAEIGTACSMAAAAVAHICGLNIYGIECSAEIAMEHNLGLTCDPVKGLVQVPCIERNAMASMKAINAYYLARFLAKKSKVSFDKIVKTMYETGKDLRSAYRETSEGGLAKAIGTDNN